MADQRFALDGLFSFSTAPLKIWTYLGLLVAFGCFAYLAVTLIQKVMFGIDVPGYASLLILLLFFNALSMISNGIQGEYIARIFEEVKGRPLYVVGQTIGFDAQPVNPTTPDPTVRPPSRMANRSPSSIATGLRSSTSSCALSPGTHISQLPMRCETPVTSVVRKKNCGV